MVLFAALMASMLKSSNVHIGNFLVTAPNGIALIQDDARAYVMDFGGDYHAELAAPDDSYHRQTLTYDGHPATLEWGRVGDSVIGQVTAKEPVMVTGKFLQNCWPDLAQWDINGQFSTGEAHVSEGNFRYAATPNSPLAFALNANRNWEPKEIAKTLSRAKAAYLAKRPKASGAWGDFLGAIADNLNNSRLYASDEKFVAHSVSRGWAGGNPNNAPFFCWDSFFNGALACLDDPETARQTVRAILSWQTPEGLVPNFGHWQFDKSRASNDRSQPPVGSLCVWKMEQRWPDKAFLKEVFPKLLKWHRWWPVYRDGDHNGLLEWGSSSAGKQGALWETGWDDTPQYADSEMVGSTLDTDAVDLNSLYAMDAEYLADIADAVGDHATASQLRAERLETIKRINDRLWNPQLGIYCSRKWESKGGAFLTRLTPMNFYPLIAGAASPEQAKQVLNVMTDPNKFWGEWVLPTVPYDDPLWPQQGYWHGTVWAPVNFLVFQGLKRYASDEMIRQYAEKSVRLFMRNWTQNGWCGENFGSNNGLVNGDKHYTWGALMCLVGLESVCNVEADGAVTLYGAQSQDLTFQNVPLHGKRYTVETGNGWARLKLGGKVVMEAHGERLTKRL